MRHRAGYTRVYVARTPRKEKQTRWRRKLPSLEMKKISFCHHCHFQIWGKPLGRTFWIVTLNMRIIQVIPMMAVRIFYANPVAKMRRTCRTRISLLAGWNVLRAKKASNYDKTVEGESGRKREKTSRKYISSEDVQRLKGSRKDCNMNVQARCEEKSRTDKSRGRYIHSYKQIHTFKLPNQERRCLPRFLSVCFMN